MTLDEENNNKPTYQRKKCCSTNLEYYPEWFPINNHLAIYQRHPTPNAWKCLKSICERNSEMTCVWSHLLCFAITAAGFYYFLRMPSESFLHEWEEKAAFSATFICSCICFAFSAFFHTFYHHSQHAFESTLKLDLLGIVLGIKGPWVPWIYYSFYCEPLLRNAYWVFVVFNSCTVAWLLTRGSLLREEKAKERAAISVGLFGGCFPGYARILYREGIVDATTMGHGWAFFGMLVGGIGVWLFCTKIPESWYSGRYNYMIGSHTIFHICSALCIWLSLAMGNALRLHRLEVGDVCPS